MARFTRKELEQRNRADDAVIVIDNVVYDVTRFLDDHPGGAEILLDNAGKDASQCFRDVGHSDDAKLWRAEFQIGEVVAADRWEVLSPVETGAAPEPPRLQALLSVFAPPLLLAALAVALYALLP
ncbi:cytochrome b5-like [Pararge aegeria]|nr:cytochrome b5-like [Pararge aegeria]